MKSHFQNIKFTEPENMTTIELNTNGYLENDKTTDVKTDENKKFRIYKIRTVLILVIASFIAVGGIISAVLWLSAQKEHFKNEPVRAPFFKIFFDNKDKVIACKASGSTEDCCYLFINDPMNTKLKKCSVEKVLNLFLQYEMEINKRAKRQSNDNYYSTDELYDPNYYQKHIPGGTADEYSNFMDFDYYGDESNYIPLIENEYNVETPLQFQQEYLESSPTYGHLPSYHETQNQLPFPQDPIILAQEHLETTTVQIISTQIIINNGTKNSTADDGDLKSELNETTPDVRISQGNDFDLKADDGMQNKQATNCLYQVASPMVPLGYDQNSLFNAMAINPNVQRPLYVINPSFYPSVPIQYTAYNPIQPVPSNRNPQIHVTGAGGQYYLCNPVSTPNNNVAGLQGVEIRRMAESFNLQDLVESVPLLIRNNKSREALNCPFGMHSCEDGSKCIHRRHICDNEVNCNDGSDELGCSCKSRVGEIRWCDGYLDCPGGDDEKHCFGCSNDEMSCDDWSRFHTGSCIPISKRCDGVKDCEFTGKDEEDCTILTDHVGQHLLHKISNAAGFLHRNYKGKWYPTCFGVDIFSLEVCKTEAGLVDMLPRTELAPVNDNYDGPFIDFSPTDGISIAKTCMRNKATFVECPPLFCGLRMMINNPFRNAEVDTSAEEFLTNMSKARKINSDPVLGISRVVGGKPSQPTSWPWVVSIYKNGVFHCGGVLVNELWILTAAHCVDKFWLFYYEIQAGILRRFSYSPMEQTRFASLAIPHPDYNRKSLKNDIALMKLSKPVRFNRYIRPICLPSAATAGDDYLRGPRPNTICVTVGWGATIEHGVDPDHLREVEVPILEHCKHREDKEGDEICAGLFEGGRDACQGDSGGPLMCQNEKNHNQWYLAGIVSHGEGCARPNEPGVYTKVSKYLGWINDNIHGKTVGRIPLRTCPGYVCFATGRCVPKKRRCDKVVDCLFGDDEFDCWQPRHRSTQILSEVVGEKRSLIEQIVDIFEVEEFSTQTAQSYNDLALEPFMCKSMLQKIPSHEKCNKAINCEDGSDEFDCSCVDYLRSVSNASICDGIIDCKDLSDETDCVKCSEDQHLCRISQKCISSEKVCDGTADCINSEDEWDCVALTDGRTLVFDRDLRPKQSMKGIITINRFGVWRPLCTNASADNVASIASNVCNLLGFEEYTVFHKLSVTDKPLNVTIDGFGMELSSLQEPPFCDGLFVRCLNVTLDEAHQLKEDNVTRQAQIFSSPWNAVIYSNGKFRCTGTILTPHWIIAVRACLHNSSLSEVYITALVGKGNSYLDVEGPHEQIVTINNIAFVQKSEAIILYTQQKIYLNRYVTAAKPATNSRFTKETCLAVSLVNRKLKTFILQEKENCNSGFRCFHESNSQCKNDNSKLWSGIITCYSKNGWYVAALYNQISTSCNFTSHAFPSIDGLNVKKAMGDDLEELKEMECDGFQCNLGDCISESKMCDGFPDCRSGEDEDPKVCHNVAEQCHLQAGCTKFPHCKMTEFKCPSGKCIPKSAFCDSIKDCGDYHDEPEECSCETYLQAVHPEKICDGNINCWDKSDEKPEKCGCGHPWSVPCGKTELCVSQEMLCDGSADCPNGEDEKQCFSLKSDKNSSKSGEVLKNKAGLWHSGCFSANHTTDELEVICKELGFLGVKTPFSPSFPPASSRPVLDRFDVVWIQRGKGNGLWFRMRTGNEQYVKLVPDEDCRSLFIEWEKVR